MPRPLVAFVICLSLGLFGCSGEKHSPANDKGGPAPTTRVVSVGESGPGESVHEAQRCTKNEDCVAIREMYLDNEHNSCCRSCNTQAVSKAWLPKGASECDARGNEGCRSGKCAAALQSVACVQGKCSLVRGD